MSLGLVAVALAVAALNLASTVILQRSQNFPRLTDVPFFSLAILVVGGLWVVSFAVLLGNVMVMWVDARGISAAKYGLGENLYEQISWVFTQQQVFAFALPLLGIVADALQGSFSQGKLSQGGSGQGKASSAMWPPAKSATRSKAQSNAKIVVSLFAIVAFGGAIQGFFNPEFFLFAGLCGGAVFGNPDSARSPAGFWNAGEGTIRPAPSHPGIDAGWHEFCAAAGSCGVGQHAHRRQTGWRARYFQR